MQQKRKKTKILSQEALTRHLENDSLERNTEGRMALIRWLEKENHSLYWLSKNLGYSYGSVRYWMTGERIPQIDAAVKIQDLTNGYVACEEWTVAYSHKKVKKSTNSGKTKKKS